MTDQKENNQNNGRRRFSSAQKFKIVKEAMTTDSSISEVCKKYKIHNVLFYRWQEEFFKGAQEGLERKKLGVKKSELRKIEKLEQDNLRMKNVIVEISSENIELKKSFGELQVKNKSLWW